MRQALHLLFCRSAATIAASWGGALLVWPGLSNWLPVGELPPLHARCIGVVHLALAVGLWSARRRLDLAATRMPLLLISGWGGAALASALESGLAGTAWLAGTALAVAGAAWLLAGNEDLDAPAERLDGGWAALGLGASALGAALLLAPDLVAGHWPWRMAPTQAAAYGAPLLGLGVMGCAAARERRRYVREPALHAWLALALGVLAASVWHRELFVPARAATWVWFGSLSAAATWAAARSGWLLPARRLGRNWRP